MSMKIWTTLRQALPQQSTPTTMALLHRLRDILQGRYSSFFVHFGDLMTKGEKFELVFKQVSLYIWAFFAKLQLSFF